MMKLGRITVMVLVLSITAWSSHSSKSAQNQYEARELLPETLGQRPKATDHLSQIHLSYDSKLKLIKHHKNIAINNRSISSKTDNDKGKHLKYIDINYFPNSKKLSRNKLRKLQRNKRSFMRYSGKPYHYDTVPYSSITVWRTYKYPISRPYYIPIFGVSDRPPIYFPPQPLLINSGEPVNNPKTPFQGPMYLPPNSPKIPSSTPPTINNRFNGGDNGDDMIVWPNFHENAQLKPTTTTTMRPTRRTTQAGQTSTHPSIIHNASGSDNSDNQVSVEGARPTIKPAKPTEAPITRPSSQGPSTCVWAILSCCTPTEEISTSCFEARGCGGFFFDSSNPCDSDFSKAAIESALNYYGS